MSTLVRAVLIVGLLLTSCAPVCASSCYAVPTSYYYYPVYYAAPSVYYTPAYITATPLVCPVATAPAVSVYATPTPAPASSGPTQEPPRKHEPKDGGPQIRESRSYERSYYSPAPDNARCRIDFRNHTGRDVTITVDGQVHFLPRGRNVTLDLDRVFAWRFDQHDPQVTRVPADRAALTVFLRD